MVATIGIRKEDKNRWECRVPLVPQDVGDMVREHGLKFIVQPSPIRVYTDDEYRAVSARVDDDLGGAGVVFAVKEVPVRLLRPGKVYAFFAHVIKGQKQNMPLLAKLMELGCTLIDYERIVDEKNRRLLFFGRHAGYAGMIETLRCHGLRLRAEGFDTPLAEVRSPHEYRDLAAAKEHIADIGRRLQAGGLPAALRPIVIGVAGYGNVAQGVNEVLAALPIETITVEELPARAARRADAPAFVRVSFREEDMVRPIDAGASFDLQEYYVRPERYASIFDVHLPALDVLVNTIYWDSRYPRFVTAEWARREYARPQAQWPRLRTIGDISCDIKGSIELTVKVTEPDAPCYVVDPVNGTVHDGVEGHGPVIMAIDNLPSELPREASRHFSSVLKHWVPLLARADFEAPLEALDLPPELTRAIVVHRGALAPEYRYLEQHLKG